MEKQEEAEVKNVPVFNKVEHKISTLQYELMMKEAAIQLEHMKTLQKINARLA